MFLHPFVMSWTQRSKTFSMYTKGLFLSNIVNKSVLICVSEHFSFAEIIHPPHRCGISRCWWDSMIIAQVCLRLATIKGLSKMCSFITQHNATDVASFERACNWHANCMNVHQNCCLWIECSFLYHKPSPKAFQWIWQYIQPASHQPRTSTFSIFTFKIVWEPPPGQLLQQSVCINKEFLHKLSETVSGKIICMLVVLIGVSTWLQFVVVTDLSGKMLTFDGV